MNKVRYIHNELGAEELLCQLAEECAELTQAALKLRRAYTGKNPTPVSLEQAIAGLLEEIADVRLCTETLLLNDEDEAEIKATTEYKTERWANRIREAREKARNG